MPPDLPSTGRPVRIAVLLPSTGLIDGEICDLAEERGAEAVIFKVAPQHVADAASADEVAAMTMEMGAPELLGQIARQTLDAEPDVLVWACTSGSFLVASGTGTAQSDAMTGAAGGLPSTTTSLAILDALRARNIQHVAVVTPYHDEIGHKFAVFLTANSFTVDGEAHAGCGSDATVGALTVEELAPLARMAVGPSTQAIAIPCTALRRGNIERDLQAEHGVPVIFANAATLDHALKIVSAQSG